MSMEQWKDITGYDGLYQVSNFGNIRSLVREKNACGQGKWRILKPRIRKRDGYMEVSLFQNNVRSTRKVHRLVAEAFLNNPMMYPEINHKDENRSNNRVDNLEWCSHRYNIDYGSRNQRISKKNSRPVYQMHNTYVVKKWPSTRAAAAEGYDSGRISDCCNGKAKHHKGYEWRWAM